MTYTMVIEQSIRDLENEVNRLMSKGFEPLGGMTTINYGDGPLFVQTMVSLGVGKEIYPIKEEYTTKKAISNNESLDNPPIKQ